MSAIKDGRYPISLNGEQYHMLFSLNVLDEVQDKFGGYDKLPEVFSDENKTYMKDLKWLLTLLINEGMEEGKEELTEKQVGKKIHVGNMKEIQNAIYGSFAYGASGGEKSSEQEDNKNVGEMNVQDS